MDASTTKTATDTKLDQKPQQQQASRPQQQASRPKRDRVEQADDETHSDKVLERWLQKKREFYRDELSGAEAKFGGGGGVSVRPSIGLFSSDTRLDPESRQKAKEGSYILDD